MLAFYSQMLICIWSWRSNITRITVHSFRRMVKTGYFILTDAQLQSSFCSDKHFTEKDQCLMKPHPSCSAIITLTGGLGGQHSNFGSCQELESQTVPILIFWFCWKFYSERERERQYDETDRTIVMQDANKGKQDTVTQFTKHTLQAGMSLNNPSS